MRIFDDLEEKKLFPSWEDQVSLVNAPLASEWIPCLTPAQIEALPLETFPIIDDFEIALTKGKWESWREHLAFFNVAFFSQQRGFLTTFGWWGHIQWDFFEASFQPLNFWDREQGWDQIIFEKDEYIYLLEGNFDDASGYSCWFRVRKERYLTEWQLAIEACRRMIRQAGGKRSFHPKKNMQMG